MNFAALDALAGEVLPERTALGIVSTPFNNAGGHDGGASSSAAAAGGGGDNNNIVVPGSGGGNHGAVGMSTCQSDLDDSTPGLLGSLGLPSQNASDSLTCVPAAFGTY